MGFLEGVNELAYEEDEKLQLAIIRLLEIAGEAANSVSDQFKEDNAQLPWLFGSSAMGSLAVTRMLPRDTKIQPSVPSKRTPLARI